MKLAILGSSSIALEAALRFHAHGAALTWFHEGTLEASEGLELLKLHQSVKPYPVISLTKRFLAPAETVSGSRFQDLFRIIYQVNPVDFINQQKELNPETYERLSSEFVSSLQSTIEMYEDFDLVLDLREETTPTSMAVTGRALGEKRVSPEKIIYGIEGLNFTPDNSTRDLAIIGSGDLSAQMLIHIFPWLKDPRSQVFIVSTEAMPFERFLEEGDPTIVKDLKKVFEVMEKEFEEDIQVFHKKLREWQELDDFVQAKMPKPAEPLSRLHYFSGHNVTAVDELIDKKRLFLTLEKPDFREGRKHPDNNHLELKTIGVDQILVGTELKKAPLEMTLEQNEKGFFSLSPSRPSIKNHWERDLKQLKGIEDEIFKLFSPRPSL